MKGLYEIKGSARRRCMRLLRRVRERAQEGRSVWVRFESEFRDVKRLSDAGLLFACVSKYRWWGDSKWPFKELELFATRDKALARYSRVLK